MASMSPSKLVKNFLSFFIFSSANALNKDKQKHIWDPLPNFTVWALNTDGVDIAGSNITVQNSFIQNFDDAVIFLCVSFFLLLILSWRWPWRRPILPGDGETVLRTCGSEIWLVFVFAIMCFDFDLCSLSRFISLWAPRLAAWRQSLSSHAFDRCCSKTSLFTTQSKAKTRSRSLFFVIEQKKNRVQEFTSNPTPETLDSV